LGLTRQIDQLRADRNIGSKSKPTDEEIKRIRAMGGEISKLETELKTKEEELNKILFMIPNINHETTPIAQDESGNKVERTIGEKPDFSFEPQEHFAIKNVKDLIDLERGAKTSGSRFYYLKGKLALLERALFQFTLDQIVSKGFELVLPPILVQEPAMFGTGFFPAEKSEIYTVNPGEDNLYLVGTSEVPMIYMYSGEVLEAKDLPKKYVAITPCFRREAGSYGKDTKGIFRVHQFYKVEMIIFSTPEQSWQLHEEILAHEESILQALGLPYQVLNICSGDLGFPAAKKYDCEGWFPGQKRYRELTSTSNTTDYQARRSNIKYKNSEGKREFIHTLNGTAVTDRCLLAILENYQQEDGSVIVPEVLRKYTGFGRI
jgi:seryl-tRNA synthetase